VQILSPHQNFWCGDNTHKRGKVYSTARLSKPILIFYEAFISGKDAKRREQYFKTTKGKKTLRLMLRETTKV